MKPDRSTSPTSRWVPALPWLGVVLCAALLGAVALGGAAWPLLFVALVPWLASLQGAATWRRTLLLAWGMSVAFTAAVFYWFGAAMGQYSGLGTPLGLAVLLLAAPLFQPQWLAYALARRWASPRFGAALGAGAAAAAWVVVEGTGVKLLGDTLGHGLYPSSLLRQGAAVGGAAGLTLLVLLCNEGLWAAWSRRRAAPRAWALPLGAALLLPLALATFGAFTTRPAVEGPSLRVGLVQANFTQVEQQRQVRGSYEVVRELLDTHYAMSHDAVERQKVDAVLWSETVYPTTFGQPKSEAGAELDREIVGIVNAAGVPFVIGTYDRDGAGEYNAAAVLQPGRGLLGMYRKTHPFLLTEHVPAWLDGPALRTALPWLGGWKPGNGARVFPLRLRDGREVVVQPMICLDDTVPSLALQGARLGAQALFTMSNDAWFTQHPQGAALHQTVAAFRSIETGLPQFRVTTNGFSAVISPTGAVVAGSRMGERTLVVGALPTAPPAPTLMVRWGDWVGAAGGLFLLVLALHASATAVAARWQLPLQDGARLPMGPVPVHVLPRAMRWLIAALRAFARLGLLGMGVAVLVDEALRVNTLAQIRTFTAVFLLPEALAWLLLRAFAAQAEWGDGGLTLTQGQRQLRLARDELDALRPWRWPMPSAGCQLRLTTGRDWPWALALPRHAPEALAQAWQLPMARPTGGWWAYLQARQAVWLGRWGHPAVKFGLLPLLLALPAFHLHQHIAYGSAVGEYLSFGLRAYLSTLLLWWAAWAIGVTLWAAALRVLIEAGTLLGAVLRPGGVLGLRRWLEAGSLAALYLGLPMWLAVRVLGA